MEDSLFKYEQNFQYKAFNKGEQKHKRAKFIAMIFFALLFTIIFVIKLNSPISKKLKKKTILVEKEVIGEINFIFDIKDTTQNVKIFGDEFKKESEFDLYINEEKINYNKEYKFKEIGQNKIRIDLYEDLNMDYMFKDVTNLTSVELKADKKNNNCKILSMISTFENCRNLNNFSISKFDLGQVKSMRKLFYNTTLLTFSFSSLNINNLEDISYMFGESRIEKILLNNFNTNKVINMSHLFEGCHYLTSIDLSTFETNEVIDMSYMFNSCSYLKNLDLSNFKTKKVKNMSYMFNNCNYLKELNLTNFLHLKLLI